MSEENNGFKEVTNLEDVHKVLEDMKKSWDEICEAFGVDPEKQIKASVLKSSIRLTMLELDELENLEYVKKSNKPLMKLHKVYLENLIKYAYTTVDTEESKAWTEEMEKYIKEIFTSEFVDEFDVKVEDNKEMTIDMLFDDINKVFSISSQLNVIKGMEGGKFNEEAFMGLISNFIFLGIGIVQACNGNAVIMGKVVTSLKVIIKINDMIIKSISKMLSK
jgi:hypothetical protein